MGSVRWSAAFAAGLLGLALISCNQTKPGTGTASLFISAQPRSIPNDGTTTTLTLLATDAAGNPGSGSVALTAAAGALAGAGPTGSVTLNSAGTGTITFACDVTLDTKCIAGPLNIAGTWNGTAGTGTVTLTKASGGTDAGPTDAGFDAGVDAGTDAGTGFGNGTKLTLAAAKPELILGIGDSTVITATLTLLDGGPIGGQPIGMSTTLGLLTPDGGTASNAVTVGTAANGTAPAVFSENGVAGNATITATHTPSGAITSLVVPIVQVKQASYVSTMCGMTPCTFLGLKGSGFQEQAQVTFSVVDALNNPVAGVSVAFSLTNTLSGLSLVPTGITNSAGLVSTTVSSGTAIGVFAVQAVVIPGTVQAISPSIGVVAVKATNNTFSFKCAPVNQPAWVAVNPPAQLTVNCNFGISDRDNHPIGTGTSVFFLTEAGSIANSAASIPYGMAGQGTGTVQFQTGFGGVWPPEDVNPLPPLTALQQPFPAARDQEPSYVDGTVTRNPRDGLITIIAYVPGEEFYQDLNGNNKWDPGEPFVDQGEPFVDANDNNAYDVGELYVDTNGNGVYDGPNGVWDSNTNVWTATQVLVTGRPQGSFPTLTPPYVGLSPSPFAAACPGGLAVGTEVGLAVFAPDFQYNRPYDGTTFQATHGSTGAILTYTGQLLDDYGFGYQRLLVQEYVDAGIVAPVDQECSFDGGQPDSGVQPVCIWQTFFTTWGSGNLQSDIIVQNPISNANPCTPDQISVTTTCLGVNLALPGDNGGIQ